MVADFNKTLLSLLIALHDLDIPLSDAEESFLANVGCQLYSDNDAWQSQIEPNLLKMIQSNARLNQLYQAAQSQLKEVSTETLLTYLPTEKTILQAMSNNQAVKRGFVPTRGNSSDRDSHEITNMAIDILSQPKPAETVKKLDAFEKIKQILTTPIC